MKRILVVGGAGYVGGAVTDQLQGHEVRVFDNLLYEESYRKPVDFVSGDILDQDLLKEQTRWADAVIWLAGIVGDGACALNPELTVAVNEHAVRWLSENFDGRIIFPSTCSVYGANQALLNEEADTSPLSLYAGTKLKAEEHLHQKNAILFRLGTLFGVGDDFARIRMDLVVNYLTARAYSEGNITIFGGEQYRPLLHVKDVATAMIQNLDTDHTGVFNLHAVNATIMDLGYKLKDHFPDLAIETTEIKFQDERNYRVSSDKARSVFGFEPSHTIDDGIAEVRELLHTRRVKDFSHPRYSNQEFLRNLPNYSSIRVRR